MARRLGCGLPIEVHLLDTGHFALEEDGEIIASHIKRFLTER